ncbi:hypothetical protein HYH02_009699 [Chlamydomonas schloesseri]|uniref:Methyltransferase type 11 domain-containing protein n=1 Tax=Chlamydomonas schloesseri TaxID=2026947 RepID=A0A835TNH2_9CHLO|nr:hypothetical protein HYH02_009699 [Chlamydomonas schloesseri]|eukprot:KAG2442215.1 hypothetical protein HYH02_009699 [Chlamydomonas schloesseri]
MSSGVVKGPLPRRAPCLAQPSRRPGHGRAQRLWCAASGAPGEEGERPAGSGPSVRPAPPATSPGFARRSALLGAAIPCCACVFCGGGGKAKAAAGASGGGARNTLYDSYFANAMRYGMDDYEAAISPIKSQLFGSLVGGLLGAGSTGSGGGGGGAPIKVLEVGIGTGPNFPFYQMALQQQQQQQGPGSEAESASAATGQRPIHIVGLDPNPEMLKFAREAATTAGFRLRQEPEAAAGNSGAGSGNSSDSTSGISNSSSGRAVEVSLVEGGAEALPFADGEFDGAVVTLVLCSVPSPTAALAELRRVVKPGGRVLLVEHVGAEPRSRPLLRLVQGALSPLQRALADGCNLDRDTLAAVRAAGWAPEVLAAPDQGWGQGLGRGAAVVAGSGGGGGGGDGGALRQFDLPGMSILAPHLAGVMVR